MSILSLRESEPIATEADELCSAIEAHLGVLRTASLGKRFSMNGAAFKLLQRDRNTIYAVKKSCSWFLKMPTSGTSDAIAREVTGAAVARAALATEAGYAHSAAIRGSVEKGYLVTAEIRGRPLHHALYRACITPGRGAMRRMEELFHCLGRSLAQLHLHHEGGSSSYEAAKSRGRFTLLSHAKRLVHDVDSVAQAIGRWAERFEPSGDDSAFVHGNFFPWNVLGDDSHVSLIDFENCGRGSIYHDLSLMCGHLVLTRSVPLFPWRRAYAVLCRFLEGYRGVLPYDASTLAKYVAAHVVQYYMRTCLGMAGGQSSRIAGIPVSKHRLRRMVPDLLEENSGICIP